VNANLRERSRRILQPSSRPRRAILEPAILPLQRITVKNQQKKGNQESMAKTYYDHDADLSLIQAKK